MTDELAKRVRRIIAETFNVDEGDITNVTTADDVDGWDSLAHTILMVRLQRNLNIAIPETLAANSPTVGALIEGLRKLRENDKS
ncbi:MAG: acyl carrier protein [Alphaproteobacteria bacterium]|nr:acyl carrier protein [Alphaproteobacteria bacterium]